MPAGTPVYPGGSNTYVKNHEASGRLTVAFSRNPNTFPLAKYAQYVPDLKEDSGYYLKVNTEEAGRLIGGELREYHWPDGADRPMRNAGTEEFAYHDFKTERYDYDFKLGQKAQRQASWEIKEYHLAVQAQKAMTARTRKAVAELANVANWDASHTDDVVNIPGVTGPWNESTTQRADIKRSLNYGHELIEKDTLGAVQRQQIQLVVGAETARKMGESQEVLDYIKASPEAYAQITGDLPNYNLEYGLPERLHGIDVVVENAVMVTSRRQAAAVAREYVMGVGDAFLISRVGELEGGVTGTPTFSTLTVFLYEEMSVETKDDTDNRRIEGHVVDDFDAQVTAPVSGYYFTNAVS